MIRRSLWALGGTLTLLATAMVAAVWILNSPQALAWALAQAAQRLPGELRVGASQGSLLGTVRLDDVHYRNGDVGIRFEHLTLQWNAAALLSGKIDIRAVDTTGVAVDVPPAAPSAGPWRFPRLPEIDLPLRIDLDRVLVRRLTINRPGATALKIDEILASGLLSERQLQLRALQVAAPDYNVSAAGRLNLSAPHRIDIDATWTTRVPGYAALSGRGTLRGDVNDLRLDHELTAPTPVALRARLLDLDGAPTWTGEATSKRFNPHRFRTDWPDLGLSGTLAGSGDLATLRLRASLDTVVPGLGAVAARIEGHGNRTAVEVERLALTLEGRETHLEARGAAQLGEDGKLRLLRVSGRWSHLRWPLRGIANITSANGEFRGEGLPQDYVFEVAADLGGPRVPAGQWSAAGRGDLTRITLERLEGNVLDGEVSATGTLAWAPLLRWNIAVDARRLDAAGLAPQWPSRLNLRTSAQGHYAERRLTTDIEVAQLEGEVRGYAVGASGRLRIDGDRYRLPRLELCSGKARLSASGELAGHWDLNWDMDAPDLAALWPLAGGRFSAQGRVTGARNEPRVVATAAGQNLRMRPGLGAADLRADIDIDLADARPSRLNIEARDIETGAARIDRIQASGRGMLLEHRLEARVETHDTRTVLFAAGAYIDGGWKARLEQADLDTARQGRWTLQQPAAIAIAQDGATVEQSCWHSDGAKLCLQGRWTAGEILDATINAQSLPLAIAAPLLPPGYSARGRFDGDLTLSLMGGSIERVDGRLALASASITLPLHASETTQLDIETGEAQLTGDLRGMAARFNLALVNTGKIQATVRLPGFHRLALPAPTQPLVADIFARITDLAFLPTFVPIFEDTQGQVDAQLHVAGTVAQPRISGETRLTRGTAVLIDQRIRLQDVAIAITSGGDRVVNWRGFARSGKGTLNLTGETRLDQSNWPTHYVMKGDHFTIYDRPDLHIVASTPRLDVRLAGRSLRLEGDVTLPRARVEPQQAQARALVVKPSEDIVVINAPRPEREATLWDTALSIRVILGDDVRFAGFGLRSQIRGRLVLNKEPDKIITAAGNLEMLSGDYRAYGQELDIQRGTVIYAGGPLDNPGIDLRAVRVINDTITVGIQARGRLREPVLSLFSEPSLEETFILSYLVLGRTPGEATATEAEVLVRAASALGLSGGYVIAKRLAQSLGIEETRVERDTLVLGRSLGPDIYISYGIALTEQTNTLQIRYQISRHWSLKTESGPENMADLLYSIER